MAGPAVGASLLPKFACSVCSPTYAALLSFLGLEFLVSTKCLLPLTLVFLSLAIGALGYRASARRGLGPFWIGVVAAGSVLVGKFWFNSSVLTNVGVGLLVLASVWNAVPRRSTASFCPACLPTEAGSMK